MTSSFFLSATFGLYALVTIFYIAFFVFKNQKLAKTGFIVLLVGFAANTIGFLLRWYESHQMGYGHIPLSNMYESLVFFAWTIAALFIFLDIKYKEPIIGVFATPLIFLCMAAASFDKIAHNKIAPLLPALKSNWLAAHVITCFVGYAGFAVAFGFSIMYFIKSASKSDESVFSRLPAFEVIDELTYQMIVFGFLFLTLGIVTGSVWANSAWGKYWTWDPKEVWSLITWIVYAVFMHLRLMRGWQGKNLAWVSIIGFLCVLFTYFGVNFLLSGLHSYA